MDTGKPYMKSLPTSESISVGDTLTLDCKPKGLPMPEVEWYVGSQLINASTPSNESRFTFPQSNTTGFVPNSKLVLKKAKASDRETYYCKAINEHGEYEDSTLVRVKGE